MSKETVFSREDLPSESGFDGAPIGFNWIFLDREYSTFYYRKKTIEEKEMLSGIPEQCCTLDVSGSEQQSLIAMFRALGNPIRFEILKFLITHPGCITGNIVDHLPIAQATVSQHLKVLRDAGWIEGETRGPATCYCLDKVRFAWFKRKVGEIF